MAWRRTGHARSSAFIAMELGRSAADVTAMVLGGHGDSMAPLPRHATVSGIPVSEWIPTDRLDAIVDRTRNGGAEIVGLLKTGSAYYAPSSSTVEMVDAVLKDKHKILPCCCYLQGEFGIKDLYVGVPAQLGQKGIEKIWEIKLTDTEAAALKKSAGAVEEFVDILKLRLPGPPVPPAGHAQHGGAEREAHEGGVQQDCHRQREAEHRTRSSSPRANAPKTATMMAAALVISRPCGRGPRRALRRRRGRLAAPRPPGDRNTS